MQPSEKITPLHRRARWAQRYRSYRPMREKLMGKAEATVHQQQQRHRILKGGGSWRIGDRKGLMLPAVRIAADSIVRIRATSRCWTREFKILQR